MSWLTVRRRLNIGWPGATLSRGGANYPITLTLFPTPKDILVYLQVFFFFFSHVGFGVVLKELKIIQKWFGDGHARDIMALWKEGDSIAIGTASTMHCRRAKLRMLT